MRFWSLGMLAPLHLFKSMDKNVRRLYASAAAIIPTSRLTMPSLLCHVERGCHSPGVVPRHVAKEHIGAGSKMNMQTFRLIGLEL
jgi:hypothetical protein